MKKMPVLFVGHGSPMNVLDKDNPFNQNFSLITQNFPKPKAILMISAHWYSSRLQVTSGEHPEMIYDFYGFPDELSQVQYPAPCSIKTTFLSMCYHQLYPPLKKFLELS